VSGTQVADALAHLPDYLGNHVLVSLAALVLGLAVSVPLAVSSLSRPRLRAVLLGAASIVQTVPGLALLALFYPLLLGLAGLCERAFGFGFSAFGFLPAVLALALYSLLPVVRNTITGILGIDPAIRRAALGVGMTPRQSLRMVELPLALPVIMAGIRTASVWVIGTATLSTPIGQTSLGNYIFAGLQTQNWVFVLFGCIAAAALALAVDQLLGLIERGFAARRRNLVIAGTLGLALIVASALAPVVSHGADRGYVVGAKSFSEQYILAALIGSRLQAANFPVRRRDGLGSAVIFEALEQGDVDVYVDYTGTIWANRMHRTDVKPRQETLADVAAWLKQRHVVMLGGLGFENAYALAMTSQRAQALGIRTLADLAPHAASLSIAADYEFFSRPEWKAIKDKYGLAFGQERQMQAEFMYAAVAAGEVDVIAAYTSDGRIAKLGLQVLDDPRQAIPPYDAILLIAPRRANDPKLAAALRPLIGAIPVEAMREANQRAAEGASPAEAARWLNQQIAR
jgi:osmoprotectant transport system permease protein